MSKDIIPAAAPDFTPMTPAQIDAYYARLGLQDASRTPSLENLRELHARHLTVIPFENLDFLKGIITDTSLPGTFEKVINHRRGGLCSELNGMFAWLLRSLGYDVTTYAARLTSAEAPFQPRRHCINGVAINGTRYLCDVGVARENFRYPLPMEDGAEQRDEHGTYKLVRHPFFGWLLLQRYTDDGDFTGYYGFSEEPQQLFDFDYIIGYSEMHPNSEDNKGNFAAKLTDTGCNNLLGNRFWRFENGQRTDERDIASPEQLVALLRDEFNLDFEPNERYLAAVFG